MNRFPLVNGETSAPRSAGPPDPSGSTRCRAERGCDRRLGTAHGQGDQACWLLPDPLSEGHGPMAMLQKLERCLTCRVFTQRAEADPRGWACFTVEQLRHVVGGLFDQVLENMEGFFQILTNLPDGLFTVDRDNRVNYFNPAAERITGLSSSEVIGRHCQEVFGAEFREFDFSAVHCGDGWECPESREFTIERGGGSGVPVISNHSLIRDRRGEVTGAVEVFKEITVRKRLEDELRKSELKYRRIFEGSKDMIIVISADGRIKDVNPAGIDLLDYDRKEDILGLPSVKEIFVNPMHADVFQKQITRWGFIKDFETLLRTKEDVRVQCLLSGSAVLGANGELLAYEGIAKDVTARMDAVQSLRQRHRELSLLNSVALVMNATQDLPAILDTALEKVLEVLGIKGGAVVMIDHRRAALRIEAHRGLVCRPPEQTPEVTLRDSLLMRSLFKSDLSLAPEHAYPPFQATVPGSGEGEASELTCFLINGKEKARGFLALDLAPTRELAESDVGLLGSLANFLGGAIENARLHQTVRQHREELKRLTAELFQSQETERKRIARELHDEAGQALTGINLTLEAIDKRLSSGQPDLRGPIAEVRRQVSHTYQEMRRISHRLHPALLSDIGLKPALEAYFTRIARHSGVEIDFRMVGFEERLAPEVETTLYRLSQEAFNNTLKHSGAKHFRLSIIRGFPDIIFVAEDDGRGFEPKEVMQNGRSLGLVCMRERASIVGGTFSLRASAGTGTHIRITIPVQEAWS